MHAAIRGGAELIGTALLVAAVIGSGIMAEAVTSDVGLRLLLNQLSTILGLGVLIAVFLPVSGAHINPVITFALFLRRALSGADAVMYVLAQLLGSLGGVVLAHLMFGEVLRIGSPRARLSARLLPLRVSLP
jgi:glycerol uptake facilitator-like aquaporin